MKYLALLAVTSAAAAATSIGPCKIEVLNPPTSIQVTHMKTATGYYKSLATTQYRVGCVASGATPCQFTEVWEHYPWRGRQPRWPENFAGYPRKYNWTMDCGDSDPLEMHKPVSNDNTTLLGCDHSHTWRFSVWKGAPGTVQIPVTEWTSTYMTPKCPTSIK